MDICTYVHMYIPFQWYNLCMCNTSQGHSSHFCPPPVQLPKCVRFTHKQFNVGTEVHILAVQQLLLKGLWAMTDGACDITLCTYTVLYAPTHTYCTNNTLSARLQRRLYVHMHINISAMISAIPYSTVATWYTQESTHHHITTSWHNWPGWLTIQLWNQIQMYLEKYLRTYVHTCAHITHVRVVVPLRNYRCRWLIPHTYTLNFCRVKLLQFAQISSHPRKFQPTKFRLAGWPAVCT